MRRSPFCPRTRPTRREGRNRGHDITSRLVIDSSALQMVLIVLTGWLERRERSALAFLIEENRLLQRQLGGRRLRFTDDDRRRLAGLAHRVVRATLREIATIVTPDTLRRCIGNSLCGNGRVPHARAVVGYSWRSDSWSSEWRRKIRVGATRASREPSRTWGIELAAQRSHAS